MASGNVVRKMLQQGIKSLAEGGGFDQHLSKIRVISGGAGKCMAELKIGEEHKNRGGNIHGGMTSLLVDMVSTMALMTTERAVPGVSVELSVSFMKAAKVGEEILIDAETLRVGRNLAFLNVEITNKETGTIIATGKHTKYVG
ncbi:unnamed protein product, partial [Meganyctiphanes norvegica]